MGAALALALAASLPCPRGFEAIGADGCLAAPTGFTSADKVIVYFHGMIAEGRFEKVPEFQVLRAAAIRRGYALVAMRGEQGLCTWEGTRTWWCWPNDRSQLAQAGRTLERLGRLLAKVSQRLKLKVERPFLAGFSNGGFFLSLVLSDAEVDSRGVAVLHGGALTGQEFVKPQRSPVLLVAATDDKVQLPAMQQLAAALDAAGWTAQFTVHPGQHEVGAADADALLDFCDECRAER